MRQISRRTVLTIIAGTIISLLLLLLDALKGAFASIFPHLPLWIILVSIVVVIVLVTAFGLWYERLKSTPETLATAQENRQRMLQRVQTKWITGFLENDRYYDKELLLLPLCRRVGDPWDSELQDPLESSEPLPLDTKLSNVFDKADRRLLILGDPGTGKTTLLLELTRDLLKRAENDERYPIPVVLLLSSWTTKQLSLEKWIVEELQSEKYQQVPREIAQSWVDNSQLLLLLDGLDEVAPDALPACIEAVNKYVAQANRSIAICSRTEEYLKQGKRLSLRTAVSVQPLSFQRVEEYLSTLGKGVSGLKDALEQEQVKTLRKLVTTPLFLKILILTYHGKSAEELLPLIETASSKEQHMLFHAFVERMLQKDGPRIHATTQQTKHWLAWLARQLTSHQQNELYLERLQPDWLPKGRRALYYWSVGLVGGLFYGLVSGLVSGLFYGLGVGLVIGRFYGLASGLLIGLLLLNEKEINLAAALTWSWKELTDGLLDGLLGGVAGGVVGGRLFGLRAGLLSGLFFGLVNWLVGGLLSRLEKKELTEYYIRESRYQALLHRESATGGRRANGKEEFSPNESMRHSVKNGLLIPVGALVIGLVVGLVIGLVAQQAKAPPVFVLFRWPISLQQINTPAFGLSLGLVGGLLYGLVYGLGAVVKHYILRFWLSRSRTFPWNVVSFLDDVVEQQLLRKVGGGYIFRHRLLQDYFALLDTSPSEEAPTASASLQKPDEKHQRLGFTQKEI